MSKQRGRTEKIYNLPPQRNVSYYMLCYARNLIVLSLWAFVGLSGRCAKTEPILCDLKDHPCSCDNHNLLGGTCTEYTGIELAQVKDKCTDGTPSTTEMCLQKNRVGTCQVNLKSSKEKVDYEHYYSPLYSASTAEAFCTTGGTLGKVFSFGQIEWKWLPE